MRGRAASAPAKPVAQKTPATPAANVGAVPPSRNQAAAGGAAAATQSQPAATLATAPAIDEAKVDAEVAKRLGAERAKLEQQMRAQQQAAQQQAATPQLPPPVLTRRNVEPQPQTAQIKPIVPQPAAPPPAQPVTQTVAQAVPPPAPAPQQPPSPPKAKYGELVTPGSEDVVARMIHRADIPYPPMARAEGVAGTVLVSALISETGRVLQVRVIRGINRPGGLNEAAMEIVRRSTFSPPMKDGVAVKAWTTVPVDFKL